MKTIKKNLYNKQSKCFDEKRLLRQIKLCKPTTMSKKIEIGFKNFIEDLMKTGEPKNTGNPCIKDMKNGLYEINTGTDKMWTGKKGVDLFMKMTKEYEKELNKKLK